MEIKNSFPQREEIDPQAAIRDAFDSQPPHVRKMIQALTKQGIPLADSLSAVGQLLQANSSQGSPSEYED